MTNSQPVRRSRRGEKHTFTAGDKVEVVRTEGFEIGTLLHKIEDDDSDSPSHGASSRWMVAFQDSETEEISEKRLVEISNESESSASNNKKKSVTAATKRTKAKNNSRFALPHNHAKASEDEHGETVIKVKMLTGTLYLYRGMNPRAEFVRMV